MFKIESAKVDATGVATVDFKITDTAGDPLDLNGKYTEGAVNASFIIAALATDSNGNPTQYQPYITHSVTSPITNQTASQPTADSGGTYTEIGKGQGEYEYTFKTKITVADPSQTQTVGVWATRSYNNQTYVSNDEYSFVPASGTPLVRQLITNDACNSCHGTLEAHGGSRRDVQLCTMCHVAGVVDPDTGNTIDFRVMIHKIHRGADLPSVVAGGKYEIIGYQQRAHDYSDVVFPQPIDNCTKCHSGADKDDWKTQPNRAACGSCHDDISFAPLPVPAGMTPHPGGPQSDDKLCNVCHKPTGGLQGAGITDAHYDAQLDPNRPEPVINIVSVTNTGRGQTPVLDFNVTVNGTPRDLINDPLTTLRVTLAGPTTDYAGYTQYTINPSDLTTNGSNFEYRFPAPMPANATGTYAVGMEAYNTVNGVEYAAFNPVTFVAVTDPAPVPRRTVVTEDNCNNCHAKLSAHGGIRRNVQYCILCHDPNTANEGRVARLEDQTEFAHSVDLKPMIHSIHNGANLTQPYVLGGYPPPTVANPKGNPQSFNDLAYPRPQNECNACHATGTNDLPLPAGVLPSRSVTFTCNDANPQPNTYCTSRTGVVSYTPPVTSACTSCHDSTSAIAHAEVMTTSNGAESCATCHGPGTSFDADVAHAAAP